MLVERLESWSAAASLRESWNSLAGRVPFRQWEWLGTWWRHYGADQEWFVLAVRGPDGRLAGIAPWRRRHVSAFGNVVQFLGSGETCSDYLTVLCAEEDQAPVTAALAEWLLAANQRAGDDGWDMLHLDGIAANDGAMTQLLQHLKQNGCVVHARSDVHLWRIPLPDSWEGYRRQLSKPNRRHVRVLQERMVQPGRVSTHVATSGDDLTRAWAILVDLHQRRRRELGQAGCFASPRFAGFAWEAAEAFSERGALELLWIEHEGAPLAAQLGFLGGGATYAYQVGIDPAKRAESPGWLVHSESIKRAITLGHTTFDFLRGDEEYKHRMGAKGHPLWTIRVVAPRIGPRMLHTAWVTGDAVKDWIRAGLEKSGLR